MDTRLVLFGALALTVAATATPAHDALLDAALARPALPASAVRGLIETTSTLVGGKEPEVETKRVDPVKEPKKAFASYSELQNVVGPDAHVVAHTSGRTTYAFTTSRLPKGLVQAGDINVGMDGDQGNEPFDGIAVVTPDASGKPYISQLDLRLHRKAGNWLVRVKRIDITYTFLPTGETGAMAANTLAVDVDMRALFFMHRTARATAVMVAAAP